MDEIYQDPNLLSQSVPDVQSFEQQTQNQFGSDQSVDQDITGMPLNQIIDQEIIGMVVGRQKASEQWRTPYRLEWDEAKDNYEQIYDSTGKEGWQATTFQPMTTTFVERSTAALHGMSMGSEAPVEYQPRSSDKVLDERINCVNEIIQHDLEKSGFKVQWADFCRTLSLYGTAIGKSNYLKEEATVMVKERKKPIIPILGGLMQQMGDFFGFGGQQQEQDRLVPQRRLVKDYATFENKDIYNIYPQPHIEEITKDTWIIEKFKITNKELLEGARNPDPYYRLDNVTTSLLMNGSQTFNDPETIAKRMAENDWDVSMPYMQPDQQHDGLEYWGPVPKWFLYPELRDDEVAKYEVEYAWIWVIDGQWVVRNRVTPFIDACPPYDKGNYIRRPGQFYGIGNGKLLSGLQGEKNEIRNTRQDNINLILNKILAVLKDKVQKDEWNKLVSDPGAIWPFTGIDDVRKVVMPIEMPDITQDSWRGSAEVDREAQEVTDVIKTTQTIGAGEDQAGNGTFRGQLLNHETANERFKLYASVLEIAALKKIIDRQYQRIYQFKSYEQIGKILGEKRAATFELIPCEDLNDVAKLVSLGSLTTQNKGLQLAQMREFFALFAKEPFLKKIDYARKMYRLIGSGSDPDEVMMSDEELKIYNEFKQKLLTSMGGEAIPTPGGPGAPKPPMPNGNPMPNEGPIAGGSPQPMNGMPRPPMPANGPGVSNMDMAGRPL